MGYLLFFIYLAVFCMLIPRISFFKKSGLAAKWLIGLFLIRVVVALLHAYIDINVLSPADSAEIHRLALRHYDMLKANPLDFFMDLFRSQYGNEYGELFGVEHSYWNNLKLNLQLKIVALFDLVSFSNFYVNTLLFNMLVFAGSVGLYRALTTKNKDLNLLLVIGVFLFPSGLFFTSAIQKDGFVWLLLCLIILMLSELQDVGWSLNRGVVILLCMVVLFALRSYLVLILLPAMIAFWMSGKKPAYSKWIFLGMALLTGMLFFGTRYIIPKADFPEIMVTRQRAFAESATGSNTGLPMPGLQPDVVSYAKAFLPAVKHAFLMPLPVKQEQPLLLPFAFELLMMELLFIMTLVKRKKNSEPLHHLLAFVAIVNILLIGYIVGNLGAIIRYRSLYLNLFFILFLLKIDFNYFRSILYIKNKKI
ncbi:MAG: hypothetical protein J5I50_05295 [Chitinophagaceae bacterium]|nr:hypothetical protein [Chitinophagaceae bacterium]